MDCSPPGFAVHGDSPGENTGVGCQALLQGIFPTQGSRPGLPHCRRILYQLRQQALGKWKFIAKEQGGILVDGKLLREKKKSGIRRFLAKNEPNQILAEDRPGYTDIFWGMVGGVGPPWWFRW